MNFPLLLLISRSPENSKASPWRPMCKRTSARFESAGRILVYQGLSGSARSRRPRLASHATQATVNGRCGIRLHKGNATVIGRVQLGQHSRDPPWQLWRRPTVCDHAASKDSSIVSGGCRARLWAPAAPLGANQRVTLARQLQSSRALDRTNHRSNKARQFQLGSAWLLTRNGGRCCG